MRQTARLKPKIIAKALDYCLMLLSIAIIASIFVMSSCNKATNIETTRLIGSVNLEDSDTHTGITISLYSIVPDNEEVVTIREDSEIVAFNLDQNHLFDYWMHNPIYSSLTDETGGVLLDVVPGLYNIAIYKEGYSLMIGHSILVAGKELSLRDIMGEDLILSPIVHYSGVYSQETMEWSNSNDIYIDADTYFLENTNLEIGVGTRIFIAVNASLHIHGQLNVTSSTLNPVEINVVPSHNPVASFNYVRISETANVVNSTLEWMILKNSNSGLVVSADNINISNCYISSYQSALTVNSSSMIWLDSSIVTAAAGSVAYAADFTVCGSPRVTNSIIIGGDYGLRYNVVSNGIIDNCFISGRLLAISLEFDTSAALTHTNISSGSKGLRVYLRTQFSLSFSNVTAIVGVDVAGANTSGSVTRSNMDCITTAINYIAHYGGDMDATNCYWGTTDSEMIQSLIIDKNDYDVHYGWYDRLYIVLFTPFQDRKILNAGLR